MRTSTLTRRALVAVALATAGGLTYAATAADARTPVAVAMLRTADGTRLGRVWFYDDAKAGQTVVKVALSVPGGVTALGDFHGFHVHANDVATNGVGCVADPAAAPATWFTSADGHLRHGATETHAGHAGDLPSLYVTADGLVRATSTIDRIVPGELGGKAVVLHAGRDNFGNVPVGPALDQYTPNAADATTKTAGTGNAGDRFACGVLVAA